MNGNITSNGNASITEYGFLWSTAAGNFSNTLKVGTDNHSGSFTATLGSLAAGTTYYLQAYARNEAGTSKGAVMTFTTAAALPPPVNPTHPFSDVPASYWAGSVINNLSSLGYISGYPDGTFRPGNRITRAELVTIVDKVLKLAPYTPQTPTFSDVNPSDWFYPVMETAVHAGVVKGYGDGTFHPDAPVSRQEVACILVRALGESQLADANARALTKFPDDHDIAGWARGCVFTALQQGIVHGYPDNTFGPGHETSRAEVCTIIGNFLNTLQAE